MLPPVSIHAPTRGATCRKGSQEEAHTGFNPRAHAGRDAVPCRTICRWKFQSTRPRGARQPAVDSGPDPQLFQSTRPRGARLSGVMGMSNVSSVSIHAPTRGATPDGITRYHPHSVSIHAPTRGATRSAPSGPDRATFQSTRPRGARPGGGSSCTYYTSFNPRAHAGRDLVVVLHVHTILVSIHAPTRGATATGYLKNR